MSVWLIKSSKGEFVPRIYPTKREAMRIIKSVFDKSYTPYQLNTELTFVW